MFSIRKTKTPDLREFRANDGIRSRTPCPSASPASALGDVTRGIVAARPESAQTRERRRRRASPPPPSAARGLQARVPERDRPEDAVVEDRELGADAGDKRPRRQRGG